MAKSKWKDAFDKSLDQSKVVSDRHRLETAVLDTGYSLTRLGEAFAKAAEYLSNVNMKYRDMVDDYEAEKNQKR